VSELRRELGPLHATGIVIGAIVGVGIFFTPAKVAAIAGSASGAIGLWALGGLIALCGALSMAEIGSRFPASGGELVALRRLWGRLPSFLYGWSLIGAIQTGVLALIVLFGARNLGVALGFEWGDNEIRLAATGMIVLLGGVNLLGVKPGAWVQTTTSAVKVLLLLLLAALGAWALTRPETVGAAEAPAIAATSVPWLAGLAATLFSYGGFHQVTWVGGEVRRPERTLPLAIVIGVLIVIATYMAANLAYFALLPAASVAASGSVAADAVATVLPTVGRAAALALCISAFGVANAQVLTAPRAYFALAQEGLFPAALSRVDARRGVPNLAILVQAALAIGMLWAARGNSLEQLVTGVVFVDWVFHMIVVAGLIRAGRAGAGYRMPLWPLPAVLFIAGAGVGLGATFFDPAVRQASLLGCAWIGIGALVFFAQDRLKIRQRAS
jgi:amino acid transporter